MNNTLPHLITPNSVSIYENYVRVLFNSIQILITIFWSFDSKYLSDLILWAQPVEITFLHGEFMNDLMKHAVMSAPVLQLKRNSIY